MDSNETSINQFDDVDDFNNYNTASISDYPGFSYDIKVFYSEPEILTGVNAEKYFFTYSDDPTNYKSIAIFHVAHLTLTTLNDTLIITPNYKIMIQKVFKIFTLVEMLIVIVAVGIIGSMTASFNSRIRYFC